MRPTSLPSRPTCAPSRAAPAIGLSFALLASTGLTGPALAQQAPAPDPFIGDPVRVPEVSVTGAAPGLRGYLAPESSTALRLPAPIQDVPVAVQVVPDTLIQDRAALTVRQAVETVSGVTSSNAIPGSVALRIRGFNDGSANLRDGFRETSNQQDVQGIERIDILKGPASVLYGGNLSSGGVANIVTRAPVDGRFGTVSGTVGNYGLFRSTFDINEGDVTGDGTLGFRLDAALDRSNSYRDFGGSSSQFINPSLRWRPTAQDEVVIRAQYLRSDFSYGLYQSPLSRQTLSLPLSRNFDDPNQGASRRDAGRVSYNWVHSFGEGLRFRSGLNASGVDYDLGTDRFSTLRILADNRTVQRTTIFGPQHIRDYDLQNELSGTFMTGPVRHDWLVGAESYWSANTSVGFQTTLPNLDLLNPVYGVVPGAARLASNTRSSFANHAGYVQDFVTLTPELRVLLGGRYDSTETSSRNRITGVEGENSAGRFSPRIGIAYEPISDTTLFANWANSFVPTTATTASGAALSPSTSEQFEVGVKQVFLSGRAQATVALFHITRTNVPTTDPANPVFSIASGEQRSRGVEVDLAGEILPGWNAVASYAFTEAEVTRDNRLPIGNNLAGVARHAGQVWTTYEFGGGSPLRGVGIGGGVRAESRREATLPNTFSLPAYARLDAAAWYRFEVSRTPLRAQVNVQNINHQRIYDTDGANTLRVNVPFTVLASLTAQF
ncbi:TonB-dependent siderophore receptor [Pararoseomonas indoligenes]|uniref:TonB-dependent siderophore receptor n=1 Tax=Roseomonas indoligenes TaxID=2820811 RepID=A0A940S2L5_9PROT|nr:TonB-dependent siderophore receptor [Pararoseomonas indoligenes]MBP0491246.1 TonB-dependent siderophore receptor [Pararoseomonas indoligenes]